MAADGDRTRDDRTGEPGSWLSRIRPGAGAAGVPRILLCSALLSVGLSGTGVAVAAAVGGTAVSHRPEAVTAAPRLPHGARAVGVLSGTSRVSGVVALKLRNQAAAQRFLASVTNPRSRVYRHYLARGQFANLFGPTRQAVAAVEAQLKSDGLRVTGAASNGILVEFSGTAARVESAFATGLEQVRLANGSLGRATTSAVKVPANIASRVTAVLGLDQLVHDTTNITHRTKLAERRSSTTLRPRTATGGPSACSDAQQAGTVGGLTDQQIASAYGLDSLYSSGDLASGQTVDIFEEEPFLKSDVQTFDECYFGSDNTGNIHVINVDGGPEAGPGFGEAALDIENVSAMAPNAHIHVFQGPLTGVGGVDVWNAIAVADDARQITSSWGLCETAMQEGGPGQQQVENEIFEQTAAQGQTVFNAAGDDGSDSCAGQAANPVAPDLSVSDPASQPYVTGVGGTTMENPTDPPSETVWDNGTTGGGGGGGISESWAMPSWQTASAVSQNASDQACSNDPTGTADDYHLADYPTVLPAGTPCREVPDVSAAADPQTGITIYWDGSWGLIGGTSSASPIWAAILAEVNASSACSLGSSPVGFVSPLFYQIAQSGEYADAFNDITSGNNDNLGVGDGSEYTAGTGYDMASGLGTPRVTDASGAPGLDAQLCADAAAENSGTAPQVTSLSPSDGPIAGGQTITVSGNNFGASRGSVYFSTSKATVVSWSNKAIQVTTPPYLEPPATPAGSAGRALVTVVTSGGKSSPPSGASAFDYTAGSSGGTPVVDYISAPYGSTAGGNTVEIVGSGLSGATVDFGDVPATIDNVSSNSDNELRVTVPKSDGTCAVPATQGMCAVAVMVTIGGHTSSGPTILPAYVGPITFGPDGSFAAPAGCDCEVTQAPEEYDYASKATISSVSPSYMDEGGTSTAVITGTGFNLLTYEWTNIGPADQNQSQDYELEGISPTTVTVGVSADPNSTVELDPWQLSVQSAEQTSDAYTIEYAGTPNLTSISRHVVSQSDPGSLTIEGQGLFDVNSVVFSDQQGLGFGYSQSMAITNQSDTQLTVAIPQFFAIPTDVLVCSVTGCSAADPSTDTLVFAYPGRPTVTSRSPSSGPPAGGTTVTINGTFDSNITAVDFGKKAATINSEPVGTVSGQVSVTAPPGVPRSKVNITISTDGGQLVRQPTSAVTSAATFTYGPAKFVLGKPKVGKNGSITYDLKAPAVGTFKGKGATTLYGVSKPYGSGSVKASHAKRVVLVIKPSKAAKAALAQGKTLKVKVTVTFKPTGASAVTHRGTVTVRGHKK